MKFTSKKPILNILRELDPFKRFKTLKQQYYNQQRRCDNLEKAIKNAEATKPNTQPSDLESLQSRYINAQKSELDIYTQLVHYQKKLSKVAVSLGLSATLLASGIAIANTSRANNDFNNTLEEGFSYTQVNEGYNDPSYMQFKEDLERYVELFNESNLSSTEKAELSNLKNRIKSSPEEITTFSLEVLTTKLANALGIDDFSRITILDNSTQVRADKYHPESGTITDITIYLDNNPIFKNKAFQNIYDGTITKYSDTIPQEVLDVINSIVDAQKNPQNSKSAFKALKSALNTDTKGITNSNEKPEMEIEQ